MTGLRDRRDDGRCLGQQAEDDHEDTCCGDDPARLHAGQAHQADVLREAGVGEGVQDAAQQGGQAVGAQGVGDVARGDALAHDLAGGEDVARGLHGGDGHDDDHGDDCCQRELGMPEVEGGCNGNPAGLADAGEVGLAHCEGNGRHDQQREENGERSHEALEEALNDDDDRDGAKREAESLVRQCSLGRVVGGLIGPSDNVFGGDRQERRTHDRQEGARDDRREEA